VATEIMERHESAASGLPRNGRQALRLRLLINICAAFVAGVGLVALLGWVFELPVLASLGSGLIPVAPSTAEMFILYALAVFLRANLPFHRRTYWAGLTINAGGALIAALLFVVSSLGIRLEAEHLGFSIQHAPGVTPVGHMSPVTAFCFLLSSLSYLLSLLSPRSRWRPANIAWWLACCIIATGSTLVLAYLYGTPILYGSAFIPPAALTSIAFMALGTALLALTAPHAWPALPNVESTTRASYTLLLVFVLLAGGIVTSGFLYYRNYETRHRTEVERQLSAVADLKVAELVKWRSERIADAEIIFKNDTFSHLALRYFRNPRDREAKRQLREWVSEYPKQDEYDQVRLIDPRGVTLMSVPAERPLASAAVSKRAADVMRSGRIEIVDFYRHDYDHRIYLSVLIPIPDATAGNRAIGVVSLRIDPEKYLYPFILRWPTPSETAETLLVRREGNGALFLNELRFRKNAALNLRRSLDRKESPAAQAVLGRQGITEGKDYRGVPVIADVRAVPGSPWFLVARMDISEVYGPAREKLWMTIVLVMALVIGAGGGVGLVWRRERTQFYRVQYEMTAALRASEVRYRRLFEAAKDGILILDAETGMVVDVNPFLCEKLGFLREDFLGKKVWELGFFKDILANQANFEELQQKGYTRYEDMPLETSDGRRFDVEFVSNVYRVNRQKVIQCNIRDITERKKKEKEIEEKNAELERFIYTISHDLKSPLVTVKTFLGYIREDLAAADTGRIEKDMGYVHTAAEKMGLLLDELLEMSRVGRMVNPLVTVTFRELVDEALNAVAGSIAKRKVEVRVSDEAVTLYGDRPRLVEIWQNLVENAVKFMGDQASPRIEIGAERAGPATTFFVRDNGMGIDPRYREKVFGLFDKLDPRSEGTGLGLALVKRIVELYNGKIRLESEGTGKGACFRFTLPEALHDQQDKGERI
jgi:PAS domain S-box-containing protein